MLVYNQNNELLYIIEKTATLEADKKIFDTVVGENTTVYSFGTNTAEGTITVEGTLVAL